MDHLLCINTNSFPAENIETAKELFMDSIQGILQLFVESDDRVVFYLDLLDDRNLYRLELSQGFAYQDFLDYLQEENEYDLLSVLYDIEDKSPALDFFDEEAIDSITEYTYFLEGHELHLNPAVFSIADHLGAKLLSLNTSPEWSSHQLGFNITRCGEFNQEKCVVDNISTKSHGELLYTLYNSLDLNDACPIQDISDELLLWFLELSAENRNIVYKKLKHCHELDFRGNEPLFKKLTGTNAVWEVRFSAFSGGAIRILYKLRGSTTVLLLGFIKKSNDEGYDQNITRAEEIFNR
jgi:hypothetical protein